MARYSVVHIAPAVDPLTLERQALQGVDCDISSIACRSEGEIIEAVKKADVILNSNMPVTRRVIAALEHCQLAVRYGHGYDSIDVDAATEHGMMVSNIAGFSTEEVSNHALMLLLACSRHLVQYDRALKAGQWAAGWNRYGVMSPVGPVHGETLGIVGLGHIGRALARKARALGMRIIVHDPYVYPWIAKEYDVPLVGFPQLLAESDYISVHCPLTAETRHMFSEAQLRAMKPTAYLITTARGPVVDQAALVRALKEKWIAGAGLDVFEQEPTPPDNPLFKLDNVVCTPHVASYSDNSHQDLKRRAGEEAARVLKGYWPQLLVNPEVAGKIPARKGGLRPF